jgi:hypothetical protein
MAEPVPGFVLHFAAAGDLGGFAGGATLTNPGTAASTERATAICAVARSFAAQLGANNAGPSSAGTGWPPASRASK